MYENMWCQDPTYMQAVELAQQNLGAHVSLGQLVGHLGELSRSLCDWDCTTFGSVQKTLAQF